MSGFPWGILFRERFAAFCLAPIVGRESVLFQIKFLHLSRNRNRLYVTLSQCQDKSWVEHLVPTSRQVSRHSNHILSRGVVRQTGNRVAICTFRGLLSTAGQKTIWSSRLIAFFPDVIRYLPSKPIFTRSYLLGPGWEAVRPMPRRCCCSCAGCFLSRPMTMSWRHVRRNSEPTARSSSTTDRCWPRVSATVCRLSTSLCRDTRFSW